MGVGVGVPFGDDDGAATRTKIEALLPRSRFGGFGSIAGSIAALRSKREILKKAEIGVWPIAPEPRRPLPRTRAGRFVLLPIRRDLLRFRISFGPIRHLRRQDSQFGNAIW
jgi:hypothetical protein